MSRSAEETRHKRIDREIDRLRRCLKEVAASKKSMVQGLVRRAAFLRIELEDLEADINEQGATELGVHGTKIRAAAQHYEKMVRAYTNVCKQLADLIPVSASGGGGSGDAFQKLLARKTSGKTESNK